MPPKAKPVSAKSPPPTPEEIGWTIRMPRALADRVKARAVALSAQGRGKWTGNMVVVDAIEQAAKGWK